MRYMGGKANIAKEIIAAILADGAPRDRWFEPFVGGGSVMAAAAPVFGKCLGMDAHPDLIMMWRKVTEEYWSPPHTVTEEQYKALKHAEPSAMRGFVGFGCSFGGKWFDGYGKEDARVGRPISAGSALACVKQGAVFAKHGVTFQHGEFGTRIPAPGTVLYCDPPYAGTTGYSTQKFNHNEFYAKLLAYSRNGTIIYLSEYGVPDGIPARLVWAKNVQMMVSDNTRRAEERLYRIGEE